MNYILIRGAKVGTEANNDVTDDYIEVLMALKHYDC